MVNGEDKPEKGNTFKILSSVHVFRVDGRGINSNTH